jgi:hypothetical protein
MPIYWLNESRDLERDFPPIGTAQIWLCTAFRRATVLFYTRHGIPAGSAVPISKVQSRHGELSARHREASYTSRCRRYRP